MDGAKRTVVWATLETHIKFRISVIPNQSISVGKLNCFSRNSWDFSGILDKKSRKKGKLRID